MRALDDFTTWLKKALIDMLKPWEDKVKNACPSGMICWFYIKETETVSGTTRIKSPDGWIVCDGRTYSVDGGTTTETAPNLCGTYNYICGTNSAANVGEKLEPGLPNIAGTVTSIWGYGRNNKSGKPVGSGSLTWTSQGSTYDDEGSGNAYLLGHIGIDASAPAGSIYRKNFNKVQPASIQLVPCMKI